MEASNQVHVVVLAAGKGTRMKSQVPKVLHGIAGLTIIERVLRTAADREAANHHRGRGTWRRRAQGFPGAGEVPDAAVRAPGTAARNRPRVAPNPARPGRKVRHPRSAFRRCAAAHAATRSARCSKRTPRRARPQPSLPRTCQRPYGYGRIVRTSGRITKIVEERDASDAQRKITEINSGIYAFALEPLFKALDSLGTANNQGEYYLPDLIAIYRKQRKPVATYTVARMDEVRGINSRTELAEVSTMVRQQKNEELMAAGVTLIDPATTYVDADVVVGPDTVIYPVRVSRGVDQDWLGVRDPLRRPHREFDGGRSCVCA